MGLNLYVGARGIRGHACRAKPNSIEGSISIANNTFFRQGYVDLMLPSAYKIVNQLLANAAGNMCMLDPVMVGACKRALGLSDRRNICCYGILTMGSALTGYSFANCPHRDATDKFPDKLVSELVNNIAATDSGADREMVQYIRTWIERMGLLSVPTTCSYEFVGTFVDDLPPTAAVPTTLCYFLFPSLGLAFLLQSGSVLQFFGAAVEHCTSVCVAVCGDKVHYTSATGRVVAWGAAGTAAAFAAPGQFAGRGKVGTRTTGKVVPLMRRASTTPTKRLRRNGGLPQSGNATTARRAAVHSRESSPEHSPVSSPKRKIVRGRRRRTPQVTTTPPPTAGDDNVDHWDNAMGDGGDRFLDLDYDEAAPANSHS